MIVPVIAAWLAAGHLVLFTLISVAVWRDERTEPNRTDWEIIPLIIAFWPGALYLFAASERERDR